MNTNPIRYRFAILLLWAVLALVANPVLHAFSHDHTDSQEDVTEHIADIQWAEEDLCPYCDAVSQCVEPPVIEASIVPVVIQWDSEAYSIFYPDLRLRLSTRLRAPPFIA